MTALRFIIFLAIIAAAVTSGMLLGMRYERGVQEAQKAYQILLVERPLFDGRVRRR